MANSISQKLRIKDNTTLLTIHPPENFLKGLGKLPAGVKIKSDGKDYDQVHWFVKNQAQMEKEMSKVMKLVRENMIVWVYYPKGSSGMQTDLTRDKGWDCLLAEDDKLAWINLISLDDTWSVFGFSAKTEADRKKAAKERRFNSANLRNWILAMFIAFPLLCVGAQTNKVYIQVPSGRWNLAFSTNLPIWYTARVTITGPTTYPIKIDFKEHHRFFKLTIAPPF